MSSAASVNSTPTGESAGPLAPSLVPTDLNAVWTSTLGVDAVCEANGISREDFLQGKGADATLLELFLVVMPRCPPLQYFPNVTSLRLMHLSLERIEQVQHLPRLRQLWLSENSIARIDGRFGVLLRGVAFGFGHTSRHEPSGSHKLVVHNSEITIWPEPPRLQIDRLS